MSYKINYTYLISGWCKFAVLIVLVGVTIIAQGQEIRLIPVFNNTVVQPGDTLDIELNLESSNTSHNKVTVNCIIKNEKGIERIVRWPLINKAGIVQLILDKNLPAGFYNFYFYAQQGIFQINGRLISPSKQDILKTSLINNKGGISFAEIKVNHDNSFTFKNFIFENYANVIFADKKGKQGNLDISIETPLDSGYLPLAVAAKRIKVGEVNDTNFSTDIKLTKEDSLLIRPSYSLQEVVVYSTKKNIVDRYEENYVSGVFRDAESKAFGVIDDPQASSSTDVLEYLQVKVPNLRITFNNNGDAIVKMRNMTVQFYLDEIPMDANLIRGISIADIAVVKFFNPPFISNPGGNGGAVAVYTRRGVDVISSQRGQYRFRVRGYTPALSTLSVKD